MPAWKALSSAGAPSGRWAQVPVWTGSRWVVWGGYNSDSINGLADGAVYDPGSDQWTPIATERAPAPRGLHAAVWTGTHVLIWGGKGEREHNDGGLFDPATDAGLEMNDEDLGQTFGKWGSKPGPYLVLPFLGPSTVRDTVGKLADQFTWPLAYLEDDSTRIGLRPSIFSSMSLAAACICAKSAACSTHSARSISATFTLISRVKCSTWLTSDSSRFTPEEILSTSCRDAGRSLTSLPSRDA